MSWGGTEDNASAGYDATFAASGITFDPAGCRLAPPVRSCTKDPAGASAGAPAGTNGDSWATVPIWPSGDSTR